MADAPETGEAVARLLAAAEALTERLDAIEERLDEAERRDSVVRVARGVSDSGDLAAAREAVATISALDAQLDELAERLARRQRPATDWGKLAERLLPVLAQRLLTAPAPPSGPVE